MTFFDRRLALLLTQLAFAVLLVNEIVQLATANAKLSDVIAHQSANDATIKRIDQQLDSLARGTQRLAQNGDPQAAAIIAQLGQNGVHINAKPSE